MQNRFESTLGSISRVHEIVPSDEMEQRAMEDITSAQIRLKTNEDTGSTWVKCPVCGKNVKGDDHSINIHLGK